MNRMLAACLDALSFGLIVFAWSLWCEVGGPGFPWESPLGPHGEAVTAMGVGLVWGLRGSVGRAGPALMGTILGMIGGVVSVFLVESLVHTSDFMMGGALVLGGAGGRLTPRWFERQDRLRRARWAEVPAEGWFQEPEPEPDPDDDPERLILAA